MNIKSIFSSAIQLTFASMLIRLLGLISFPILTRLLSPESYGVASLASTFISIFMILGMAGQDASYVKCFHDQLNFNRDEVDRFYNSYAWIAGGGAALLSGLAWWVFTLWQGIESSPIVIFFIMFAVTGGVVATFLQARARLLGIYSKLTFSLVLSALIATGATIFTASFVRSDEAALLVGNVSYWIILLILPAASLTVKVPPLSSMKREKIISMMSIGFPLLATAPGYWVISSSDKWFLASYATKYDLGIYAVGVTIGSLGQIATTALCSVWYPELSKQMQSNVGGEVDYEHLAKIQTLIIWVLASTCFIISFFGSDLVSLLTTEKFSEAARYIPLIALGLLFYGVNQFQGFGFTMLKKNHILPIIWSVGTGLSLVANYYLVPNFGGYGAALSQCISYGTVAYATWFVSRSYMPFQPRWVKLTLCFFIYLVAVLVSLYFSSLFTHLSIFLFKAIFSLIILPVTLLWVVDLNFESLFNAAIARIKIRREDED